MIVEGITVTDLIEFLKTQPPGLKIAYNRYSEYCLLELSDIKVIECSTQRSDGWVHLKRDDVPTQMYLAFPGN